MRFPLPLAPFELMMYRDDYRPEYPMWFEIACDFAGEIDRASFEEAVRLAVSRHPLMAARVVEIKGYPHWTPRDQIGKLVYWALEGETRILEQFYERVTLEESCGVRVLAIPEGDNIRVVWRLHHSCCDGIGGSRLIGDTLAIYHGLVTRTDWSSRLLPLDESLLSRRAHLDRLRTLTAEKMTSEPPPAKKMTWKERWQSFYRPIRETIHFLTASPSPVATGSPQPASARRYSIITKKLTAEQSREVSDHAKSLNVNVNDILIAGLFRTLLRWNQEHLRVAPKGFFRITMPTNQRTRDDKQMSISNVLSYAFLDRCSAEIADWSSLVAGISFSTTAIKRWNLSLQFLSTLAMLARWPYSIRLLIQGRRCFSSAVMSNLGDPSSCFDATLERTEGKIQAGHLVMESMYAAPPVRPKTCLSVLACYYHGCLSLGAMIDPQTLQRDEGMKLLEMLTTEILPGQRSSG